MGSVSISRLIFFNTKVSAYSFDNITAKSLAMLAKIELSAYLNLKRIVYSLIFSILSTTFEKLTL